MDIVDFHAHILPRADHGSYSSDMTRAQLKLAAESGITRIVATPHFYPHVEDAPSFLARREACYKRFLEHGYLDVPKIKLGAEVLICDNIEEMPMLDSLCLEGTKVLLLELPFKDFSDSYVSSVRALVNSGYTVILAHADRYDANNIDRLIEAGALLQLNADSLSRLFVKKYIKRWLTQNKVCAIGSDIHGANKKPYVNFNKAIKRLGDHAEYIKKCSDNLWNKGEK